MAQRTEPQDADAQIAVLEGRLQKSRFYFSVIGIWALASLALALTFASIVITGFRSFPREAQYWCLAITVASLILAAVFLKTQKDDVFQVESQLRQWRAHRRGVSAGAGGSEGADAVRNRYKAESWEYVEEARARAARNRRTHNTFQAVIILGSILVTSLTSAMASSSPLNWITVLVSILVSASAGLSGYFKFRERGFNLQQTANALEKEYNSAHLRIHDYSEFGPDRDEDALRLFAERVEALKEEQRNRELQLEQSPERSSSYASGIQGTPSG